MPSNTASVQYYRHLPAPTVRLYPHFNANDDADALKKAMKGFGCDEKGILEILCRRSNEQRQQIKQAYKLKYGEDLMKQVKSELKGDLEDLIVGLLYQRDEYDASELYKAMKGLGTDELVLTEILATRTNAEIAAIKTAYLQQYEKDLEKALSGDTSSHFKTFLLNLCKGSRDESNHVDYAKAKEQAKILAEGDGLKKLGSDDNAFNQWLSTQNFSQLQELFRQYRLLANKDIEEGIEKNVSGDIRDALTAVVQISKGRENYFVNRLNSAMKGRGTDDKTLIRIIVSRSERDLLTICQEWERQFANSLETAIVSETSGKYKDAMLTLVRGNSAA